MMGKCYRIFSQSLTLSKEKQVSFITAECRKIFSKTNYKDIQIFQDKVSRILKETCAGALPKSMNEFFKKQIQWYMTNYESKLLGSLQNIKGTYLK